MTRKLSKRAQKIFEAALRGQYMRIAELPPEEIVLLFDHALDYIAEQKRRLEREIAEKRAAFAEWEQTEASMRAARNEVLAAQQELLAATSKGSG